MDFVLPDEVVERPKPARKPAAPRVTCPCCDYEFDLPNEGKPRSYPQLKRYHAMVRDAYFHWPDNHPRIKFSALDDAGLPLKGAALSRDIFRCRKYLEMQANYRDLVMRVPLLGVERSHAKILVEGALFAAFKGVKGGGFAYPEFMGGEMLIYVSRSIRYEKLKHKEACQLFDDVEQLIYAETGRRFDDKGFSQIGAERPHED